MIISISYRRTIHSLPVINLFSIFVYNLVLSNFLLESGLSYFLVLSICLLLVYVLSAAGCHCFDLGYAYRVDQNVVTHHQSIRVGISTCITSHRMSRV